MKKLIFLAVTALVMMGIAFTSCNSKNSYSSVKLKSDIDSVSFIFGKAQGINFKQYQGEPMMEQWPVKGNIDAFMAGYMLGLQNPDDTLLLGKNMQEAGEFVNAVFTAAQEKQTAESKAEADKFLAENKGKSGVITTESGLQYKVITEGKGPKPKLEDMVKLHYHGTLVNGEVFESSVQRGEPIDWQVGNFMDGFKEGLQLMPVGSKYTFWIPTELGYNSPGHQFYNKLLIFEVELLEILKEK